jgi:hypothetical protein
VPADRLDHRLGFAGEPPPGDPGGLDSGEQQLVVPFPVFLKDSRDPCVPKTSSSTPKR